MDKGLVILTNENQGLNMAGPSNSMEGEHISGKENDVLDMSLLCRICGATSDYLIPIFEGEGLDNDLCKKISDYLPIKVLRRELLPEQTCYQCASTLLAWHDLVQCCIQADLTLREKLKLGHPRQAKKRKLPDVTLEETVQKVSENTAQAAAKRGPPVRWIPTKPNEEELSNEAPVLSKSSLEYSPLPGMPFSVPQAWSTDSEDDNLPIAETLAHRLPARDSESLRNQLVHCYFCKAKVVAKTYMKHVRKHATEKVNSCEKCGKCFRFPSALYRHNIEIHQGIRKFKCEHCGLTFHRQQVLQAHVRKTHTKECVKVCEQCGKSFFNMTYFLVHRKKHAEQAQRKVEQIDNGEAGPVEVVRKHPCPLCDRKFWRRGQLKNHTLTHNSDKPHPCVLCHRKYKVKGRLLQHLKLHHPEQTMPTLY